MNLKKLSLRTRIFLAMILLVLLASVLISAVAIYQYKEQSGDYHKERLERNEQNIQTHLKRVLNGRQNTWEVKTGTAYLYDAKGSYREIDCPARDIKCAIPSHFKVEQVRVKRSAQPTAFVNGITRFLETYDVN